MKDKASGQTRRPRPRPDSCKDLRQSARFCDSRSFSLVSVLFFFICLEFRLYGEKKKKKTSKTPCLTTSFTISVGRGGSFITEKQKIYPKKMMTVFTHKSFTTKKNTGKENWETNQRRDKGRGLIRDKHPLLSLASTFEIRR